MIANQLKAIKALTNAAPPPPRGPQTRPSILYGPKDAADIDLQTLLPIALSGIFWTNQQVSLFTSPCNLLISL